MYEKVLKHPGSLGVLSVSKGRTLKQTGLSRDFVFLFFPCFVFPESVVAFERLLRFLVFAFCLLLSISASATEWSRTFSKPDAYVTGDAIQQTAQGDYVVGGATGVSNLGIDYKAALMKISPTGTLLWSKTFDWCNRCAIGAIGVFPNEDLLVILIPTFSADITIPNVARLTTDGNLVWRRSLSNFPHDLAILDTGFAIVATASPSVGMNIMRFDDLGTLLWQKTFNPPQSWTNGKIARTKEGGILATARLTSTLQTWVYKVDPSGNLEWQKIFAGDNAGAPIQENASGDIYVANYNGLDLEVFKLTSDGAGIWARFLDGPGNAVATSLAVTSDQGVVVTARTSGVSQAHFLTVRYGPTGTLLWKKDFNIGGDNYRIIASNDGGFAVAGTLLDGSTYGGVWVLKMDSNGLISGTCSFTSDATGTLSSGTLNGTNSTVIGQTGNATIAVQNGSSANLVLNQGEHCSDLDPFLIHCLPSSFTLDRNNSSSSTCTVQSYNGWTGVVALSCENFPANSTCNFDDSQLSVNANSSAQSTLHFGSGTASAGEYAITGRATENTSTAVSTILVRILGMDASPNPASMGSIELGQTQQQAVSITNISSGNLGILSISSPSSPFSISSNSCTGVTLSSGNSCSLTISFSPTSALAFSSSFTLLLSTFDTLTVNLQGTGVLPPLSAPLVAPNGGESWAYSPDSANRKQHVVSWGINSYFPVNRIKLSYTTNGSDWTCIADSAGTDCSASNYSAGDTLTKTEQNFVWEMPTLDEVPAGQIFPSATSRIKVEIWDNQSTPNTGQGISQSDFFIIQPTTTGTRTLILWNSARVVSKYETPNKDALLAKLTQLKDHEKVSGVILDLDSVPAVQSAYSDWDNAPTDQSKANAVSTAVWNYLYGSGGQLATYTNAQFLILVGDDYQIPFYRMTDGCSIYPESRYTSAPESFLDPGSRVGSAAAANLFLTDNYYSEFQPENSGLTSPHEKIYLNDLYVGRLVETPAQMMNVINTYLAQDGQVNVVGATGNVLVTGTDFMYDSALDIKNEYKSPPYSKPTDCLLDNPDAAGGNGCSAFNTDLPFTPADMLSQLLNATPHRINEVNTHATHFSFSASTPFTGGGQDTNLCTNASYDPVKCYSSDMNSSGSDLTGMVLYTSGCHSGLSVPDLDPANDPRPLDLPEEMATKKVVAYIGNTGYGWGLHEGSSYTEKLMQGITDQLLKNSSISMGKAMAEAKRDYRLHEKRYDVFDEKVIHELTLFGIPNYLVVTSTQGGFAPLQQQAELPKADGPDAGCANGVCMQKKLLSPGHIAPQKLRNTKLRKHGKYASAPSLLLLGSIPPGVTQLDLNFQFGNAICPPDCPSTYDLITTPDGNYYKLNGQASGETGDVIQPLFTYDSTLSGTIAHGAMLVGGAYTEYALPNPVIAVPRSTLTDGVGSEGSIPGARAIIPSVDSTFNTLSGVTLTAANLVAHTGAYDGFAGTESLFNDMQFTQYYSNSSDITAPVITDPGASFHTLNGLSASFSASVCDGVPCLASGVYRVLVTYEDTKANAWKSLDLAYNSTSGRWEGSLNLKGNIIYFVQAVDNAGNVGALTLSGPDQDSNSANYGSTWSGPKTYPITLPDGDSDGMPDAYEAQYACLSAGSNDSVSDPDYDGLTNLQEFGYDTNPCKGDSDGGGDNDGSEKARGRDPLNKADDRLLTITVSHNGSSYTIDWNDALGNNASIDGYYFVYRSSIPQFGPPDRINATPIGTCGSRPSCTTTLHQYIDSNPACSTCYYSVWNYQLDTAPPSVQAVVSGSGSSSGGITVNVFGENFASGAKIYFDGILASSIVFVNSSQLRCATPAHAVGAVDVKVSNPNGQEGTLSSGYNYVP